MGAAHNDQAVNSQYLGFLSRRCDIYYEQGTEESQDIGDSPKRRCAEDENETWNCRSAFGCALLVVGRLFHGEQVGDPARDPDVLRCLARQPSGAVDIAVRRDKEMQANAGMIKLPVAVLNHGNTVKNTEYSFLANIFAARGYLVHQPSA